MRYQHILLVDDDEDDQEVFLSALQQVADSVVCTTATNGRQALQKLASKEITPDLIFLDLNMPMMDGRQFLRAIKSQEEQSHIPVIMFSTSADPATIIETKRLGAADFITKPDKFDELREILRSVLL